MAVVKNRKVFESLLNVYDATIERVSYIFDTYDNISLSVSGGKDSTVLFHFINQEAIKRNRKFYCYFLDQEAEYQSTADIMEYMMSQPNVIPCWYQVPIFMTNAVSQDQLYLWAWGIGEQWVRDKSPLAIHKIKGNYPKRFYKFNYWHESNLAKLEGKTISIIGLRAEESPDRWFATTGGDVEGVGFWLRPNIRNTKIDLAYPICDWRFTDVWKYLTENKLRYNKIYDLMYMNGYKLKDMRVSNLIHERAFRSLGDLQELEPETYDKLCDRLKGVHCAGIYANDPMMYSIRKLPSAFKTWTEYRVFLLNNLHPELKRIFEYQFMRMENGAVGNPYYERYMVKRILLCDWEGNFIDKSDSVNKSNFYSSEQIKERIKMKKKDLVLQKWLSI